MEMVVPAAGQIPEIAEHPGHSPKISNPLKFLQALLVEATRLRQVTLCRGDVPQAGQRDSHAAEVARRTERVQGRFVGRSCDRIIALLLGDVGEVTEAQDKLSGAQLLPQPQRPLNVRTRQVISSGFIPADRQSAFHRRNPLFIAKLKLYFKAEIHQPRA